MQVEHINPFVDSLSKTFETMLGCEAKRGELSLAHPSKRQFPISSVIGLSGRAAGMVVINFSEEVAKQAASAMLMMEVTELNEDVLDAVGEVANMVAGSAKAQLEEYELSISLPNIVTGKDHEIHFPSDTTPICVPFDTDFGPVRLEVGLEPVAAAATA